MTRAATAAEMIYALEERHDNSGMSDEQCRDYQIFIQAAVHVIVASIPEYIRPANIGIDVVHMCRASEEGDPWGNC